MLRVQYGCNVNPHYYFFHSVLAGLDVKSPVTIQCDAVKESIHTRGEERVFSSSITNCQTANLDTQRSTQNVVCNRRIRSIRKE